VGKKIKPEQAALRWKWN